MGRKFKKSDGRTFRAANIVYAARCKTNCDLYIDNTRQELRKMFNKHRYDAKNIPDKNEIAPKIHKYQHDQDIKPGY